MMLHRKTAYSTSETATEKPAISFHSKLKITGVGWLNSGVLFYLEDDNGSTYVMNDTMMRECIKNTDIFIEGEWDYYQQGTSYSIGLAE